VRTALACRGGRRHRAARSELTLLETLIAPLRNGFRQPNTALVPITRDVLREAARLRPATPGLRTPDALHAAATALLTVP
jgi:hypothetical protein